MRLWLLGALLAAGAVTSPAQALEPWSGGSTPSLVLADLEGATHRLADYRGKTVLVNFWATWCGPCREEMPSIERLRRALEDRPFAVLAVNVGEGGRVARDFAAKVGLGSTVLLDRDTQTARAWGARILPATYILGPDGNVRYRHFGALDWSSPEVREAIYALMP